MNNQPDKCAFKMFPYYFFSPCLIYGWLRGIPILNMVSLVKKLFRPGHSSVQTILCFSIFFHLKAPHTPSLTLTFPCALFSPTAFPLLPLLQPLVCSSSWNTLPHAQLVPLPSSNPCAHVTITNRPALTTIFRLQPYFPHVLRVTAYLLCKLNTFLPWFYSSKI